MKRLREAAGLHQGDAAKRIDTTKSRVGHFETGRNLPNLPPGFDNAATTRVLTQHPNMIVRVLPYAVGAHASLHGSFTLLEFPIDRDPGIVYLEDRGGGRYRDDTEDIDEYSGVADRLLESALSELRSLSLIDSIRKELAT
ncbi:Scr1 family TA system antitoxin-like transcriptional regulator [Actinosynnema sp. NPDC023587]|uniref:Scr1 family TA system antitoxin-like transcriptional regulator n=1 Tax=Actinosynnema sp. NPDC023587 TaxID=3154695 RepID=UPI0033D77999